jgi:hypothetical protein
MADIHVEKRNAIWPWILGLVVLALLIWAFVGGRDDRTGVTTPTATAPVTTTPATTETWRDDRATTPTTTAPATAAAPATTTGTMADTTMTRGVGMQQEIPIAEILEQPQQYLNQRVSGTAVVAEVVSESGLWVEQDGERMFVVIEQGAGLAGTPRGTAGTQTGTTTTTTPGTQADTQQMGQQQITQLRPGQTIQLSGMVHGQTTAAQVEAAPEARQIITTQPAFLVAQQRDIRPADGMAGQDDGW